MAKPSLLAQCQQPWQPQRLPLYLPPSSAKTRSLARGPVRLWAGHPPLGTHRCLSVSQTSGEVSGEMCTPVSQLGDLSGIPPLGAGRVSRCRPARRGPGQGAGPSQSAPPPRPDAHLAAVPARCLAWRPGRKEQARLVPGAQTLPALTAVPPHPPGRTGAAHVTQGPAPGSFALTPRHPTRGRAPIGCAAARGGRDLSGLEPQLPWVSGRCPALGEEPAPLFGLPQL